MTRVKDLIKILQALDLEAPIAYQLRTVEDVQDHMRSVEGAEISFSEAAFTLHFMQKYVTAESGLNAELLEASFKLALDAGRNPELQVVRCVVAGQNVDGTPDFHFVKVRCTPAQRDDGAYYAAAEKAAVEAGYAPSLVYDEFDSAGKALLPLFDWSTGAPVEIGHDE